MKIMRVTIYFRDGESVAELENVIQVRDEERYVVVNFKGKVIMYPHDTIDSIIIEDEEDAEI